MNKLITKLRKKYYSLGLTRQKNVLINDYYVIKFKKKDFYRGHIKFSGQFLLENELQMLSLFDGKEGFPKLLGVGDGYFIQKNSGIQLSRQNVTASIIKQLYRILDILRCNKIEHRDIKLENLLVKNGLVTLIDFEWACFKNKRFLSTTEIYFEKKISYSDKNSMEAIINILNA